MAQLISQWRFLLGALICYATSAGILYFLARPALQQAQLATEGSANTQAPMTLFVIAFLWLVGGLIASCCLISNLAIKTNHPESETKPWLGNRAWSCPVVSSEILSQIFSAWLFALISISVTIGFLMLARHLIAEGDYKPIMLMTPFALVGLGMLVPAINQVRQLLRYGRAPLAMDPYPGSIGGHVGGYIDLRLAYNSQAHFQVTLICLRKWMPKTGRRYTSRSPNLDVVWQTSGLAEVATSIAGSRLNFRFDVPEGLISSEYQSDDYHEWQLVLNADLPGPTLNRVYKIPVFLTGQYSKNIRFDSTEHSGHENFSRIEAQSILKLRRDNDGAVILKYRMFNWKKARAGLVLFAVGLGTLLPGIALLMDEVNIVGISFSFVGVPFALGGFYALFHTMSVKIDSAGLRATLKLLGIPIRTRVAKKSEIDFLGSYGAGWLAAWPKEGKAITISQGFNDDKSAHEALKAICEWSGYPIETKRLSRERNKRRKAAMKKQAIS
jgi:hypothetical protein